MKKKEKAVNITWEIIAAIARTPEAVTNAFVNQKSLKEYIVGERQFLSDQLINNLRSLQRRGYIEIKNVDGSASIRLTTKGKIKNLENPKNDVVDGKLRLISYDIPERKNSQRRQLRQSLRRIGYKQLQKSLWVCKYAKADEIDLILSELKLEKYVAYFIVEKNNIPIHLESLLK